MQVMHTEKPAIRPLMIKHLQELMGHAELYGCESEHALYTVWLQQLEHGRVKWAGSRM